MTTPDGGRGVDLDGRSGYLEVPDSPDLSIATTGQPTVEVLVRFDTLRGMPSTAGSSEGPMVHLLAKGRQHGDQEYALRLYDARSQRPNRLSAYAFNAAGGQGAGSYVQDRLVTGTWTHLAAVYDERPGGDGWGTVRLYRDGVLRDVDSLGCAYRVRPADGASPLFVGGHPGHSLLPGAIGGVAVYPRVLAPERIEAHAEAALDR